jgi:hypothetical protein
MPDGFIPPHGGYANLLSYRKAEIVYDATVYFCNRFFEKRDRTRDQMIQAARSGKQSIIRINNEKKPETLRTGNGYLAADERRQKAGTRHR